MIKTCEICSKPFDASPSANRKTCSKACGYKIIKRDAVAHNTKLCLVCEKPFYIKDHSERQPTCSKVCADNLKRKQTMDKAQQLLGEPLREGLQRRLDNGMYMYDIARDCGIVDERVVLRWMKEMDIKPRSHSEMVRLQWRDNETRRAMWGKTIKEWKYAHPQESMEHSLIGNLALQATSPTSIERSMMDALDHAGIPYKFQYVIGDKFLCDIAFPNAMLIVECDGTYWHSTPKQRRRDAGKDAYLQACGYTVLRFSDKQIENNIVACVQVIASLIG
jgi:very-short-patch-repair endonuclease